MRVSPIVPRISFKSNEIEKKNKTYNNVWPRKTNNIMSFGVVACIVDYLVSGKIANKIIRAKKMYGDFDYMKVHSLVGLGILVLGTLLGVAFNFYDEKYPDNKLGTFLDKMNKWPNSSK